MEYSKVIDHDMDEFEQLAAAEVYGAIQDAANGTDRAAQQKEFRLGMSNIGHCQQAAVFMIRQTPPSDERPKSAAFFGTVAGAAIEAQLKKTHPDWLFQSEAIFQIPSGGELGSHPDIAIPARSAVSVEEFTANARERALALQAIEDGKKNITIPEPVYVQGVWDLKSKDKLDVIKKYGPNRQQVFQLTGYASALTTTLLLMDPATGEVTADETIGVPMVDENGEPTGETVLDPTKPIWLSDVYFDRSGKQEESYSFGWWYDPAVLNEIDDWIHDTKYAVLHNAEASKDKPREWCWSYCEYATLCRGNDTDVEGLIEDPEMLAAVDLYGEGLALEREGARRKGVAKLSIPDGLSGSTGSHNVRWVDVGPTDNRAGYRKLDIRPVPGPKKPKAKKNKTVEVEVEKVTV